MTIKYALLGVLSYSPRSGYAIYKSFFEPFRPKLSEVYRTLNKMVKEDLVDFDRVIQKKTPNKNVYHLTEAGRKALDKWVKEPLKFKPDRDWFLVQLWFSDELTSKEVINNIRAYSNQIEWQVQWYDTWGKKLIPKLAKMSHKPQAILNYKLTAEYGSYMK